MDMHGLSGFHGMETVINKYKKRDYHRGYLSHTYTEASMQKFSDFLIPKSAQQVAASSLLPKNWSVLGGFSLKSSGFS